MTVLSYQSIRALCNRPDPLITDPAQGGFRSASYDLRIGSEYYLATYDNRRLPFSGRFPAPIGTFDSGRNKVLEVGANEVVLLISHEKVRMPLDLVGHLSLKLDILLKGMVMSSQSQVDAGYAGPIYGLLHNLSDGPVTIKHLQPFLRFEFEKLDFPTDRPYDGDYKWHFGLGDAVTARIRSGLSDMGEQVAAARRRVVGLGIGGALTVALGVGAILAPVQTDVSDARSDARAADVKVGDQARELEEARQRIDRLQNSIDELAKQLEEQRSRTGAATPPTTRR